MLQPGGGAGIGRAPLKFLMWGADNGCFALGDTFDSGDWLEWLAGLRTYRDRCLFATAPDVIHRLPDGTMIGDAAATLERSLPYLPTIRQLGFPAAYVSQDGADETEIPWAQFDVLFVGGGNRPIFGEKQWKLSERSWALCREAKRRGLRVHVGRVNSLARLRACRGGLLDSADGTFVKYGPDRRLPEVYDWLDVVNGQVALEEAG